MWPIILLCAFLLAPISGEYCHPGQEGQPYELFYRSPGYLDLTECNLTWSVKYDNDTLVEVSHCYVGDKFWCDFTDGFTPSKNKVDDHYLLSFKIERISPEHRDMEIILESSDPYFDKRSTLFSCRLPTYTEPIAPVCSARKMRKNGHTIRIECTAKHASPDAHCDFFQVNNDNMASYVKTKVRYSKNEFKCFTTVFVPQSGSYRYYVEMIPRLPGLDSSNTVPVKSNLSNPIVIQVDVKMLGPKQPIDVCPGQALSIQVKCEAYGFTLRPTFEWKLNDKSVLHCDDVEEKSSLNGPVFSQSHDIKSEQDLYNIQCLVHLGADGQKEELRASDTLQVTFRRLAYVDTIFTHGSGLIEDGAHKHLQRDDSLLCKMEKPTQDARGVMINCHRDGRLVIRKTSDGDRVRAFMASEDPGTMDCECKARLSDAKCRQRPHHAKITLLGEQHQESTGSIYLIPLIVMIVFIVLITIAIVCCMCWNRVRRYRSTRGNEKTPERASEEEGDAVETML